MAKTSAVEHSTFGASFMQARTSGDDWSFAKGLFDHWEYRDAREDEDDESVADLFAGW